MYPLYLEAHMRRYMVELFEYHATIVEQNDKSKVNSHDNKSIPIYPSARKLESAQALENDPYPHCSQPLDHDHYLGGLDVFEVIRDMEKILIEQKNEDRVEMIRSLKQRMIDDIVPLFVEKGLNDLQPQDQLWVGERGRTGRAGAYAPCRWFEEADLYRSTMDILRSGFEFKFSNSSLKELTDMCLEGYSGPQGEEEEEGKDPNTKPTTKPLCHCSTPPIAHVINPSTIQISPFGDQFQYAQTNAAKRQIQRCIEMDSDLHDYFCEDDCELLEWLPRELIFMIDTFSHCFERGPPGLPGPLALLCKQSDI